ncbi:MAG: TonB-dependent receptor domain-containing protein [Myxococcota bacterium]
MIRPESIEVIEGISVLWAPFADPLSRTHWSGLLIFAVVALAIGLRTMPFKTILMRVWETINHPSSRLDIQLLLGRQLLSFVSLAPTFFSAWWLSTKFVRWLDARFIAPDLSLWSDTAVAVVYSITLFVIWDLSRFVVHLCMHRLPILWRFHQVHHSAEILTPLTFHRIHPFESLLYTIRSVLVTGLMAGIFYWLFRSQLSQLTLWGVPAIGFVLNAILGNFRHSHIWISFPSAVERWFLSPAQHQLHHSIEPEHYGKNYGTWLAIWDRMLGSLLSTDKRPSQYGVPLGERNHRFNLISAWFGPIGSRLGPSALLLCVFSPLAAHADEDASSETKETQDEVGEDGSIIVYSNQTRVLEAGAAYRLDEADLSTFEYDDVMRALEALPGISTRGEDGFGLRPNIGIRGANSDRSAKVTLMEDGILLAPAPYAAPAAYYFPMSTRLAGIEVFKGAAATRYGPQTVGGALNVLTRPIPDEKSGYADVSAGLYRSGKVHAWAGGQGEHLGVLIEGVRLRSDGFKTLDSGGGTGFHRSELMLKAMARPHADLRLQLKLGYAAEESEETYLGLTETDFQRSPYRRYSASGLGLMRWQRTQAELSLNSSIGTKLQLKSTAYHHYLTRAWMKLNAFQNGPDLHDLLTTDPQSGQGAVFLDVLKGEQDSSSDQRMMIGTNDRQFHSYGWQNTVFWSQGLHNSNLELGLRLHADDVIRVHTQAPYDMLAGEPSRTDEPLETTLDSDASARALAIYAHEDLNVLPKWHLYPSARLEVIQSQMRIVGVDDTPAIVRQTILPGFGTLVSLNKWSDIFAGVYRGFSPVAPGQPEEIEPEFSWNSEAGLRFYESRRTAEVTGFFNDYQNITGQCTLSAGCDEDDINRQFNGGRVWIYGLESLAGVEPLLGKGWTLPLKSTYTFTRSRFLSAFSSNFSQFGDVDIADSLPYVAEHQASLHAGLVHSKGGVHIGTTYRSAMLDQAGRFNDDTIEIPQLLLVDLAAQWRLIEDFELYTSIQNATNQQQIVSWRPYGARPNAPFQAMIGLKWLPRT